MDKDTGREKVSINEVPGYQGGHENELKSPQSPSSKAGLRTTASINNFIPVFILLVISFSVYYNALGGDFVYDDNAQIVDNPWIRDIRNIPTIFSRSVWSFQTGVVVTNYYRPMMHIVYMLDYHLFGLKHWGFHLVNILFHCGASVLVFLVIRRLMNERRDQLSPAHLSPPFIAAMLFASHPIHTEAVSWISGLPDAAFTFFYLLSFYLYVRSKVSMSGSYLFSIACFAVAAFFKEPALTLPVMLLAHDYVFREEGIRCPDYLKRCIPYFLIGVGYLALRVHALGEFAPKTRHADLSVYQDAINIFPLFTEYLAKLLLPLDLNAFHVFHPIASLFELKGVLSLITTMVFAGLFPVTLKKNRVAFLGLLFLTVPLLPVLYIPALGENTLAERYLCLPSVGYVLLLAVFLSWARTKLPQAARSITMVFIVIWGLYTFGTISRNIVWQNSFNLWSDTVRKSPDSEEAHDNLGVAYESQGQLDRAISEYQTALRLKPDDAEVYFNLGGAYKSQGQMDRAIAEYRTALRLKPDDAETYNNLGNVYESQGQLDKAITEYQTASRLKPDFAGTHYNLGIVYESQGQLDRAIKEYQTALRLDPDFAEAHHNLGVAYESLDLWNSAITEYQTALRLKPDFHEARRHLNDIVSRQR